MGQEILTKGHRQAIAVIAKETKLANFYLTGGTALAHYYFQHRLSDDLDFFTKDEIDPIFIHEFSNQLSRLLEADGFRFERIFDRYQFFFQLNPQEELKIEFTRYPFLLLEEPNVQDGIRIDSLRDISANKLMAMLDRFDPKDFVDLYFILQTSHLTDIRRDAEKKFGGTISDLFLGSELAKVSRIEAFPKMVKALTIKELKDFFSAQAKKLAPQFLE